MKTPVTTSMLSARFAARIVPPGGLLYHGMEHAWSRQPRDYEAGHTIIEIYDRKYQHTLLGQFVTAYGADTLAAFAGAQLNLQGDVPAWTLDRAETATLVALARAAVAAIA